MRGVLVFALLMAASLAHAGSALVSMGANVNFQMATSGRSYDVATPFAVRLGYRFAFADLIGEYSYVKSSSGTEMVSIAQSNHEMILWGRKRFPLTSRLRPFVAVGAGLHVQTVSTRFGSSSEDESGTSPLAASAGGIELKLTPRLALSVEGRGTLAEGYSPKPLLGLASYLSFVF